MTIASRPVLGQTVCTASASVSVIPVNSLNHAHAHVCEEAAGLSPDRWKAMAPDWPSPYVAVIAPIVQDPAAPTCTPTTTTTPTAPAPVAPTTSSTLSRLAGRRTAPTSTAMFQYGTTPTTQPVPTSTTTTTPTVTCAPATPSSTPTTTPTTTPSAYDSYRTQRAQLYANRGLTGLVSNPPAPTPTAPTTTTATAASAQPSYAPTTVASAPATTQTAATTSSTYVYRARSGSTSPFIRGGTSTTPVTTTPTSSTTTVTSTPLVGPAGTNGTAFHCPTTGLNGQTFGSLTMLDVLSASGGAYDALGRYTVAALLNAKSGRVHVLPEAQVRNMWNDCVTRGYYEPAAGVRWGAAEIVAYMQKTIA